MLRAAGLGVGFHAHPRVQAAVAVNVRHADLTALLHLQGYRRDEIVAA
jgi:phosphoserine phosphatase